ncbi:hypothetical protein GWI33_009614 [Rhynchophorus ferrugineus]|uniref:Uncharacterized protein n=1 Tax=Rhynchophorus ferrugineus TaxID=354439 RepID=A0A834MAW3_RHYFE|nr:hypothetical protein GWI33_009614 [Rhynchophorus ferrugineus]
MDYIFVTFKNGRFDESSTSDESENTNFLPLPSSRSPFLLFFCVCTTTSKDRERSACYPRQRVVGVEGGGHRSYAPEEDAISHSARDHQPIIGPGDVG